MKVTVKEMENILKYLPDSIGCFAQITQVTSPKILKKDRNTGEEVIYKTVKKVTHQNVLLNTSYSRAMLKIDKEYESGINTMPLELSGANKFFGYYKGKPVIQYRIHERSFPKIRYIADNKIISKNKLTGILPKEYDSPIKWRKVYLENIHSIKINNNLYTLTHS